MRPWVPLTAAAVAAVVAAAVAGGAGLLPGGGRSRASGTVLEATLGRCGTGWTRPRPGPQTLLVRNSGNAIAEVRLVDRAGAVHAELEGLGPGVTRPMRVTLGAGEYALRCSDDSAGDPRTGPLVRITGGGPGGPAVPAVSENDLADAVAAYWTKVTAGVGRLADLTGALRSAVASGDLGEARRAWPPAHLAYERLGAAYGTFGDFDTEINGRPEGLPGGVRDPGWTGFHRLEYGLWHGEGAAALGRVADRLDRDVRDLRADLPRQRLDPADLPLRAHEILEATLRFELTGEADQGSGTSLRTAAANVAGTRLVLDALRPVLRTRYPRLPEAYAWLDRVDALLRGRSALSDLSAAERRRLNGATGQALELLAPIAEIAAPRRTS
ncbi:EfeM/EfeO family lipoprotein [Actinomadura logoneensis]|uniref:EfeM/EfeO family lipoprotein n=1 Tax=Actinomadura logoneensis TaxID=2293572 RepID=A0A372JDR8_9ACTN|nr:EfeM/EfeO family lipoprotein [Actinomadura logoneensis]RFU38151.1 EfeM/EfeO family lipoprotein [Actinomadura logoneensis]